MWTNTTYGLNWHDNLQLQAITNNYNRDVLNVCSRWVGVPSPPKKIKKFKIGVETRNYSSKSLYEVLTPRNLGGLTDSVSYELWLPGSAELVESTCGVKINLYHEHFPDTFEKYTGFPKFTLLFSISYVRINGQAICVLVYCYFLWSLTSLQQHVNIETFFISW